MTCYSPPCGCAIAYAMMVTTRGARSSKLTRSAGSHRAAAVRAPEQQCGHGLTLPDLAWLHWTHTTRPAWRGRGRGRGVRAAGARLVRLRQRLAEVVSRQAGDQRLAAQQPRVQAPLLQAQRHVGHVHLGASARRARHGGSAARAALRSAHARARAARRCWAGRRQRREAARRTSLLARP